MTCNGPGICSLSVLGRNGGSFLLVTRMRVEDREASSLRSSPQMAGVSSAPPGLGLIGDGAIALRPMANLEGQWDNEIRQQRNGDGRQRAKEDEDEKLPCHVVDCQKPSRTEIS